MFETIALHPIGRVARRGDESVIEVSPEYADALDGVEDQDHLWILFWMHELPPEERHRLRTHPMGNRSQPERGVFALHSPMRPNPIGVTRVKLLERQGNRLVVSGLDAQDGSPVLDIKGEPPARDS